MGMTLAQQAARLQEVIPSITRAEAVRRINVAYRDNCKAHAWRHLLKSFTLQTEAKYDAGTIDVTNASASVSGTSTSWSASWVTAPSMRRIVIEGRSEPYEVSAIGGATSLTLADAYVGDTDTELTYKLFRDAYPLPTSCGYAKLMVLYDPVLRQKLLFFNQPRFLEVRMADPTLTSTPECFTLIGQTSETTPRPQIQLYPAPSEVRTYHGWYFRRPDFLTSEGSYFDWPDEFDDMLWMLAAISFYSQPRTFSARFRDMYKTEYSNLYQKMKTEMDGQNAIESIIGSARRATGPFDFGSYLDTGNAGTTSW